MITSYTKLTVIRAYHIARLYHISMILLSLLYHINIINRRCKSKTVLLLYMMSKLSCSLYPVTTNYWKWGNSISEGITVSYLSLRTFTTWTFPKVLSWEQRLGSLRTYVFGTVKLQTYTFPGSKFQLKTAFE